MAGEPKCTDTCTVAPPAAMHGWPPCCREDLPVPPKPQQVMVSSLIAATLFAATNNALLISAPGDAAGEAFTHLAREGLLASLLPAAVLLVLAPHKPSQLGLLQARWEPAWVVRTLMVCAVVFPLADPVLFRAWQPAAEVGSALALSGSVCCVLGPVLDHTVDGLHQFRPRTALFGTFILKVHLCALVVNTFILASCAGTAKVLFLHKPLCLPCLLSTFDFNRSCCSLTPAPNRTCII